MMESKFIFFHSLYPFFLASCKISKSVSFFLIYIAVKLVLANHIEGFQIKYISRIKWWNSLYFCTCWYQKLRVDRKNIAVGVVRNCCSTLITRWMDDWMDELSWLFAYWCKFRNVKNYFNKFWVVMVKNMHEVLISKWLIFCMLHTFKRVKSYFNNHWVSIVKYAVSF